MKKIYLLILPLSIWMLSSCMKENHYPTGKSGHYGNNGQLKIAVVSDIHYMAASLLKNHAENGVAFQAYLDQDPKLIEFSDPIFKECMKQILAEKPDILLVPGDLTKDGEKVSKQELRKLMKQFDDNHIRVFVVPGNHDINNPEAAQYDGDNA